MTAVDTDILQDLEFVPQIPCEHRQHCRHDGDQPASWAVISLCPTCQGVARYHLCEPGRRVLATGIVRCPRCEWTGDWEAWVINIEPLGGAV